jgi:AraC-like DNA-binding protein
MSENIKNIPDVFILPTSARERFLPMSLPLSKPLRSRGVDLAGISRVFAPYEIGRTDPPCHILIFSVSGEAEVVTNDFKHSFRPGDLFISPARVAHDYKAGDEWQIVWFHLQDIPRWSFLREMPGRIRPSLTLPRLKWAMEGFLEESTLSQPDGNAATASYADLIMFYLERELEVHEAQLDRGVGDRFRRLWMRVNANPQHSWNVEELANAMGCSSAQLYRLTAMQYGTTPMGMVTRLRIESVKEFLRSTSYNLDHIALLVGYNTSFALSRAFKAHTGQSPRDFRNEHRRGNAGGLSSQRQ